MIFRAAQHASTSAEGRKERVGIRHKQITAAAERRIIPFARRHQARAPSGREKGNLVPEPHGGAAAAQRGERHTYPHAAAIRPPKAAASLTLPLASTTSCDLALAHPFDQLRYLRPRSSSRVLGSTLNGQSISRYPDNNHLEASTSQTSAGISVFLDAPFAPFRTSSKLAL